MRQNKLIVLVLLLLATPNLGKSQSPKLLGTCEGCEGIFEYGKKILSATDTLPHFEDDGPKMMLTGTIYEKDGKTPAKDVILFIYHTNQRGVYPTKGDETGWARRQGYIRGWVKTGSDGKYTFYTLKPATYPSRSEPAHIHPTVLEPNGTYYWLDSYLFEGDPLIEKERTEIRGGGSNVLKLVKKNGLLVAEKDIILRMNIH